MGTVEGRRRVRCMLPREVIDIDQLLDEHMPTAGEPPNAVPADTEWLRLLQYHRWHWTLDETNAGRVGISEYAAAVNEDLTNINWHVGAHEERCATAASPSPLTAPRQ